mgnify:CR=1 FL=1
MPKMKSHRGAMKRFKVTGAGKVTRHKAYKSHILTKKSQKKEKSQKRHYTFKCRSEENQLSTERIILGRI